MEEVLGLEELSVVLEYCSVEDICRIGCSCRRLREIVHSENLRVLWVRKLHEEFGASERTFLEKDLSERVLLFRRCMERKEEESISREIRDGFDMLAIKEWDLNRIKRWATLKLKKHALEDFVDFNISGEELDEDSLMEDWRMVLEFIRISELDEDEDQVEESEALKEFVFDKMRCISQLLGKMWLIGLDEMSLDGSSIARMDEITQQVEILIQEDELSGFPGNSMLKYVCILNIISLLEKNEVHNRTEQVALENLVDVLCLFLEHDQHYPPNCILSKLCLLTLKRVSAIRKPFFYSSVVSSFFEYDYPSHHERIEVLKSCVELLGEQSESWKVFKSREVPITLLKTWGNSWTENTQLIMALFLNDFSIRSLLSSFVHSSNLEIAGIQVERLPRNLRRFLHLS